MSRSPEPRPTRTRTAARRRLALWGPVVLQMAIITGLSSLSSPPGSGRIPNWVGHYLMFGGLAGLWLRAAAGGRWAGLTPPAVVTAVAGTILFGVADEAHQAFVPSRTPEFVDVLADAFGAVTAAGCAWAWGIIRRSRAGASIRRDGVAGP